MLIDECVITASKYHDFLRVTLPYTLLHCKRIIVVTSDQKFDDPTRHLCREYGVECLSTNAFYRDGARFAKGRAINRGLDQCGKRGWVLHMDADIVLPDHAGRALSEACLDSTCIYGIDRVAVPNGQAWQRYCLNKTPQSRWGCLIETPHHFPLMGRYRHKTEGYCPIGFFQLFHGNPGRESVDTRYSEAGSEAIHTDVQFSLLWDKGKRHLIPDVVAFHLDSCSAPIGANWSGRTTPEFSLDGPTPDSSGIRSYYADQGPNPNQGY